MPARTQTQILRLSRDSAEDTHKLTQTQAIQHTVDVGYYAPAARTTLNRLSVFIVFFQEIELVLANPRVLTLWV